MKIKYEIEEIELFKPRRVSFTVEEIGRSTFRVRVETPMVLSPTACFLTDPTIAEEKAREREQEELADQMADEMADEREREREEMMAVLGPARS